MTLGKHRGAGGRPATRSGFAKCTADSNTLAEAMHARYSEVLTAPQGGRRSFVCAEI
jgi:hypothetical protein